MKRLNRAARRRMQRQPTGFKVRKPRRLDLVCLVAGLIFAAAISATSLTLAESCLLAFVISTFAFSVVLGLPALDQHDKINRQQQSRDDLSPFSGG